MIEGLFCLTSLAFLSWVIFLKAKINTLQNQISDLTARLEKSKRVPAGNGKGPQAALWHAKTNFKRDRYPASAME